MYYVIIILLIKQTRKVNNIKYKTKINVSIFNFLQFLKFFKYAKVELKFSLFDIE